MDRSDQSGPRIPVRQATATDVEAVFRLLTLFATSYQPSRTDFDRNYPVAVDSPLSDLLVAEDGHDILGYIYAIDVPTLYANGLITQILELYVVESRRRSGIGTCLVNSVIARARRRNSAEVTVPTRRAGTFYEAMGFEPTAEFFHLRLAK